MCATVCIFVAHTGDTDVRVDKEAKRRSSMLFVSGHSDNVSVGIISFGETEKFAPSVHSWAPTAEDSSSCQSRNVLSGFFYNKQVENTQVCIQSAFPCFFSPVLLGP